MVKLICGKKGSGKTKKIIDMANASVAESRGDTVFIHVNNSYIFDLKYQIRFVNTSEMGISGVDMFHGFLCGLIASNYDVNLILVDGFLKIVQGDLDALEDVFAHLTQLCEKYGVDLVISVSADEAELPDFMRHLAIH